MTCPIATSIWRCTPRTRRRSVSYAWPGSTCGRETPAGPMRGPDRALELAVDLDHLMTLWYVLTYAAIIAAESEDLVRLAELLGEAELLGKRLPMRYLMIVGEALRGWLDVCEGSPGGIERIVRSVARSRTEGESLHLTYTLLLLARARGMAGELHEGRAATREGLSLSHRRNQRYLEAELWRVDGELAYRSGESEAAASLRRAVEVAERARRELVGASGAPLLGQSIPRSGAAGAARGPRRDHPFGPRSPGVPGGNRSSERVRLRGNASGTPARASSAQIEQRSTP